MMIFYYTIVIVAMLGHTVAAIECSRYGFDVSSPGSSCADIYENNPESRGKSGYYVIKTTTLFFAYCDMEMECGGVKGGWMRIADLDTKRGDACPKGWNRNADYMSYCTGSQAAGCHPTHFSTLSTSYSRVCGKVKGYQKGSMDAFYPYALAQGIQKEVYKPSVTTSRTLDGVYVDGISITSGTPRNHIWTYAVGVSDDYDYRIGGYACPCAKYPGHNPPTYVGSHYYCESGATGHHVNTRFYPDDPLWDGKGCSSENSCCYQSGAPWFFRQFPARLTGDIEVRICHDQPLSDEGVPVEQLQLYVQ